MLESKNSLPPPEKKYLSAEIHHHNIENELKKKDSTSSKAAKKKPKTGFIANFKEKAMAELNKKGSDSGEGDDHLDDLYLDKSQRQMLLHTR